MIKPGIPLKFERGTCPGMDENNHPDGYYIRVGKGLPPFAFEQDCAIYEANKHRIQVVEQMTNVGVTVPAIEIIGDGNGLTGGAYIMRPLDNPTTWASGQGLSQTVVFSPQSPIQEDWSFGIELRGELSRQFVNEGSSCVLVMVRNDRVKIKWYRDAEDGAGGGQRLEKEYAFPFKQGRWYELYIELKPLAEQENTWSLYADLTDLKNPRKNTFYLIAEPEEQPNRIKSVTMIGMGDEQQQLESGGTFLVSVDEDEAIAGI